MSETSELVAAFDAVRAAGRRAALATIVGVRGPAYRGPGAKVLVEDDGAVTCTLSGGCLESEVAAVAREVLERDAPLLRRFDLDEDVVWGLGIGCGGSIDVRIEPLAPDPALDGLFDALREGRPAALVTRLDGVPAGAGRLLVRGDGPSLGGTGDAILDEAASAVAREKLQQRHARPERCDLPSAEGRSEVFVDVALPPPELVIFGAGHDAVPLATMATTLGFAVTVVDARPAFATPERFPGARIVHAHARALAGRLRLGARDYAVIMNHHIERDRECLRFALASGSSYVGVLGPRARYERMRSALAREGYVPSREEEARVHSPVGLDLGAEPPEEVALAVLGEVLARYKGRPAGFLTGRRGAIHDRGASPSPSDPILAEG